MSRLSSAALSPAAPGSFRVAWDQERRLVSGSRSNLVVGDEEAFVSASGPCRRTRSSRTGWRMPDHDGFLAGKPVVLSFADRVMRRMNIDTSAEGRFVHRRAVSWRRSGRVVEPRRSAWHGGDRRQLTTSWSRCGWSSGGPWLSPVELAARGDRALKGFRMVFFDQTGHHAACTSTRGNGRPRIRQAGVTSSRRFDAALPQPRPGPRRR